MKSMRSVRRGVEQPMILHLSRVRLFSKSVGVWSTGAWMVFGPCWITVCGGSKKETRILGRGISPPGSPRTLVSFLLPSSTVAHRVREEPNCKTMCSCATLPTAMLWRSGGWHPLKQLQHAISIWPFFSYRIDIRCFSLRAWGATTFMEVKQKQPA